MATIFTTATRRRGDEVVLLCLCDMVYRVSHYSLAAIPETTNALNHITCCRECCLLPTSQGWISNNDAYIGLSRQSHATTHMLVWS